MRGSHVLRSCRYEGNAEEETSLNRWIWTAVAMMLVPLAALACGGDDDNTVNLGDGNEVTIGDDLPDSFPDDFPIYDGADLQGATESDRAGVSGTEAVWTTGDDFDDVKGFYDDAFADGPWKSSGDGTLPESVFWTVAKGDEDGYVLITDADDVTIIAIVGEGAGEIADDESTDDGAGDTATPDDGDSSSDDGSGPGAADLPDEVDLPDDFPDDKVDLPDDIRITNASSINAGGTQTFLVQFYSQDSTDDLTGHFKETLEGNGFSQTLQTSQDGGTYAAYSENVDGTGSVVVVSVIDGDVDGYRFVNVQVTDGQ